MSLPPVVAVSWNVEKGENLHQAADWVRAQSPDIFLMQELQPGQGEIVTELTAMTGYIAAPTAQSSNDNAIFLRECSPLVFDEEFLHPWAPWHAPANVAVRLRDEDETLSPRRISTASAHLCYWSPQIRLAEAQWLSTLSKAGWLAMVFGDWNSYRTGEGGPWDDYADKAFVANRTRRAPTEAGSPMTSPTAP
ncbi:endonuclease/exonuclease/phosphatase family protein [Streptomyces sp. NBC_00433]